jgi:hypothetical protein
MSLVQLATLSSRELVFHYVLNCRNQGLTLPYSDLEILEVWIKAIDDDSDALLLILSEILPKYFLDKKKRVPLKKINKTVLKKIKEHLLTKTH